MAGGPGADLAHRLARILDCGAVHDPLLVRLASRAVRRPFRRGESNR